MSRLVNKTILFFCVSVTACWLIAHRRPPDSDAVAPLKRGELEPAELPSVNDASLVESGSENVSAPIASVQEPVAEPVVVESPVDPGTQTALAKEDPDQLLRKLRQWASENPEAALAAALKLPVGDERDQALAAVCFGMAQRDPATAVKTAAAFQLNGSAVTENLVQQWAETDLPSALVWANDQPTGEPRDQVIARVAFVLSKNAPPDAALLVMEQIPSGPVREEAMMSVLHEWGNRDLVAAASWAAHFPDSLQERAASELEGIERYKQELARQ